MAVQRIHTKAMAGSHSHAGCISAVYHATTMQRMCDIYVPRHQHGTHSNLVLITIVTIIINMRMSRILILFGYSHLINKTVAMS